MRFSIERLRERVAEHSGDALEVGEREVHTSIMPGGSDIEAA